MEYKFRAWDKKKNKMLYLFPNDTILFKNGKCTVWKENQYNETEECFCCETFSDVIPMQYTGLKDKNNEKCYEHDIVKIYVHNGFYPDEWIEEIVFEKGQFGIRHGDLYKEFYPLSTFYKPVKTKYVPNVGEVTVESEPMFEIIGNRWENPELLKEIEGIW
jgi:uncharacterized phage protein (TIGR01671 family)